MKKSAIIYSFFLAVLFITGQILAQEPAKEFFAGRRSGLLKKMQEGGILVLAAGKTQPMRNSDLPFKQDDNFYYLTGYTTQDAICLFAPKSVNKYVLFIKKGYSYQRTGGALVKKDLLKETMQNYGADTAYFVEDFEKVFSRYSASENKIFARRSDKAEYEVISKIIKDAPGGTAKKIFEPTQYLSELRIIKTPEEIEYIKKAIAITSEAEVEAMKASKPKMNERTLDAIIGYIYRLRWASGIGFPSIVGSGPNSIILHWETNNREMQDGDMCVMDLGAAYNGYSADITRSIPVNGKFTKEQKDIYSAVLKSQKEAIKLFKPGTLPAIIEDTVANILREELFKLGLITDKNTTWQHRIWYPHGCSHPIGLDVHDATPLSYSKEGMKPNMVFTIEPGLYISISSLEQLKQVRAGGKNDKEFMDFYEKVLPVVKKYNNIGIRIEDDILITEDGNKVITSQCPKEIAEIEKVMKQKSRFVD
jgi:Xaa-Pro aminopeptidase